MWQFADASLVLQRILRMTRSSRLCCQLELTISSLAISGSGIVFLHFKVSLWSRQRSFSTSSFTKPNVRGVSQNPLSRGTSETLLLRRLLRQSVMPGLVWIPVLKHVSQKRSFLRHAKCVSSIAFHLARGLNHLEAFIASSPNALGEFRDHTVVPAKPCRAPRH